MAGPRDGLTLSQLRYFVRTAELGSMTASAAELYVAQSAVSAAIAQLESAVGCELLLRQRSRGVVLTERGRAFYASALGILAAVDDAVDTLGSERLSGALTAGCFTTLAPFWLPEIHERLTSAYPALDVRIREVTGDEVEQLLLRREMEAVLTYSFDYGRDIDLLRLSEAPLYAALPEGSPLARRDAVTLGELAALPLILLDMGKSANYFLSIFHDARLRPEVHQRFENFEVVRSMVARGHGYTILNQTPAHDLTNEGRRIVRVPISDARSTLRVGVAHRRGERLSRKGQAFVDACREALGDGPAASG
ncbi:LysR family transcriptional regulator [Rothia sp. AR01]|uniref:LysR family transcriptional regulator n=1 Tax=Rothia santali TaxID=2949643 RepID=A0A9X2HJV2_9MICC|nr:LysR family transcriptional regulator [Rothia santali]MCP3425608.1 LysR family transcriptional regulator [Rothia santali]